MPESFFSKSDMSKLMSIAIEEMSEIHEDIIKECGVLEAGNATEDTIRNLKRHFHTVGGSAGLAGLNDISAVGVEGEVFMGKNESAPAAEILPVIKELAARLRELIDKTQSGG
ncbi:MAG TPA: Hpt domain-containing protein [bacterium]|nr:Hpt domain-containing protein [bacterium]